MKIKELKQFYLSIKQENAYKKTFNFFFPWSLDRKAEKNYTCSSEKQEYADNDGEKKCGYEHFQGIRRSRGDDLQGTGFLCSALVLQDLKNQPFVEEKFQ